MKSRWSRYDIANKLRRADRMLAAGNSEFETARLLGVTLRTYRSWRKMMSSSSPGEHGRSDGSRSHQEQLAHSLVEKVDELLRLGQEQKLIGETLLAISTSSR
jgi:hypothetical protein